MVMWIYCLIANRCKIYIFYKMRLFSFPKRNAIGFFKIGVKDLSSSRFLLFALIYWLGCLGKIGVISLINVELSCLKISIAVTEQSCVEDKGEGRGYAFPIMSKRQFPCGSIIIFSFFRNIRTKAKFFKYLSGFCAFILCGKVWLSKFYIKKTKQKGKNGNIISIQRSV